MSHYQKFNAACSCPFCGSTHLRTTATYYTDKGEHVRYKRCQKCKAPFNTVQESESVLDPVIFIRHTSNTKQTKLVSLAYRGSDGELTK